MGGYRLSERTTRSTTRQHGHVSTVDVKLMPLIKSTNAQVDVLPLVNNFDPIVNEWRTDVAQMLQSKDGREALFARRSVSSSRATTTRA